ncbi:hypothetical protein L917_04846 [Phytophthora nicotianae]|uniref:Uncharacterized protein n=1 Tax=Phytophthora nicotianae TaxID=4792 RepID=W2LMW1_PHYNI|nr:hypothetical protein L917_04846 [Phytophthora nicotianae]
MWKMCFVRCWIDRHVHFDIYATSRVEGYHAALKAKFSPMRQGRRALTAFYSFNRRGSLYKNPTFTLIG